MRCTHCERCCRDTEMELCEADISRLERTGRPRGEFVLVGADGKSRLSNRDGFCVFYDRDVKRCTVYSRRPLGCVIYPVNLTSVGEIVVDDLCPEAHTVTDEELRDKGKRLRRLLDTIAAEARASLGRGPST